MTGATAMTPAVLLERYGAVALAGLIALALGFLPEPQTRVRWWADAGPEIVQAALFALPVLLAWAVRQSRAAGRAGTGLPAAELMCMLLLVLAAALLMRGIEPAFRIQADESLQVGTGFGLHLSGKPLVPSAGHYDAAGVLHADHFGMDKRGLLLPVLLSWMHALLGYSPRHGFLLNALATAAVPVLAYAGLRALSGRAVALAGGLLVLAHPVLLWCGTASGFESLNLACLLAAWAALAHGARATLPALVVAGALFAALAAQARYESVLYAAVAFVLAAHALSVTGSVRWRIALAAVSIVFVPYAWQRAAAFELSMVELGTGGPAFAPATLFQNLLHAVGLFAARRDFEPIGLALVALAIVACWPRRAATAVPDPERAAGVRISQGLAVGTGLLMVPVLAYAWGDLRDPVTLRLGLPAMALLSLAAAGGLARTLAAIRLPQGLAPAVALVGMVATSGATARPYGGDGQPVATAQNAALAWLRAGAGECRPLILFQFPTAFVVEGVSAVSGRDPVGHWPRYRDWVARGDVGGVWWLEVYDPVSGRPYPNVQPPEGFVRTLLVDRTALPRIAFRVHALDRVDAPLARACLPGRG